MADSTGIVRDLAAAIAAEARLDLVDVQVKGSGPRRLVRVVVDRKGGVDLDRCQELSRRLSAQLDDTDPIPDGYRLEVTSPGIDHPLADRRAFDRVEGRLVLVHRDRGDGKIEQVRGSVVAARDDAVVLRVDGDELPIPYEDVVRARQALPW